MLHSPEVPAGARRRLLERAVPLARARKLGAAFVGEPREGSGQPAAAGERLRVTEQLPVERVEGHVRVALEEHVEGAAPLAERVDGGDGGRVQRAAVDVRRQQQCRLLDREGVLLLQLLLRLSGPAHARVESMQVIDDERHQLLARGGHRFNVRLLGGIVQQQPQHVHRQQRRPELLPPHRVLGGREAREPARQAAAEPERQVGGAGGARPHMSRRVHQPHQPRQLDPLVQERRHALELQAAVRRAPLVGRASEGGHVLPERLMLEQLLPARGVEERVEEARRALAQADALQEAVQLELRAARLRALHTERDGVDVGQVVDHVLKHVAVVRRSGEEQADERRGDAIAIAADEHANARSLRHHHVHERERLLLARAEDVGDGHCNALEEAYAVVCALGSRRFGVREEVLEHVDDAMAMARGAGDELDLAVLVHPRRDAGEHQTEEAAQVRHAGGAARARIDERQPVQL
mmetsp:Transcript_32145/g.74902  ORF Transcript_32145/g.74902 Transcript_32145/m.74902 type:complete len:467 (-) Transcript_32145:313-1713(-)